MCSFHSVSALKSSVWILTRRSICPSFFTLTRSLTRTRGWRGSTQSRFPTLSLRPRRVRSFLYQGTARLNPTGLIVVHIQVNILTLFAISLMCTQHEEHRWQHHQRCLTERVKCAEVHFCQWDGKNLCCCKIAVDGHRGSTVFHPHIVLSWPWDRE